MNQAPLVSIVIPAFNPRFFAQALDSALAQTYQPLEIVVCDDSAGDEIQRIVEGVCEPAHPVRYLRNPQRLGLQKNILRGVQEADGELIKVLCDDDRLFAPSVALQAPILAEYPEVSLVCGLRVFSDAGNSILPSRLDNSCFSLCDSVFKGDDMLGILEGWQSNYLGNFSSTLMRRADVLELLPALIQEGAGFVALLDTALFICLLRRGNLATLNTVLSCERLYPGRFSATPEVLKLAGSEWDWLKQMLAARAGESAPAAGWVRYVDLVRAGEEPRRWQELCVTRVLGNRNTVVNGRVGGASQSYEEFYREWLGSRCLSPSEQRHLPQRLDSWSRQVRIVPVVIDVDGSAVALERTLSSLDAQLYAPQAVLVLSDADCSTRERVLQQPLRGDGLQQLNELLPQLEGCDWFYLLQAGDRLSASALLVLAERIASIPTMLGAYSDEGALVESESVEPVFKPDFNLDLMRSYPYVGRTLAFSRERVLAEGGFDPARGELAPHDLLWRLVETAGPQAIEHIAEIQVESEFSFAQWLSRPQVIEASEGLVSAHLQRIGVEHRICHDDLPLINRIDYLHGKRPLVSIIITCGDSLAALQRCVESLIEQTAYNHYEILLVDAGSRDPAMADWLAAMAQLGASLLRVLACDGGGNQAALVNEVAAQARGEYLLLLSHDAQICTRDWLDELLNQAQRPEVGIVGARILAADGSILHAGQVLGLAGPVGSPFVGEALGARGYMQRLQVVQNWSAVSADCLMVRKEVFDSLGGLAQEDFNTGLGVADFCLRVDRDGYLVVWTPHATLMQGAASRVDGAVTQEVLVSDQEAFYRRWLARIARDPAYNPALSLGFSSFSLEPTLRNNWNPFYSRSLPLILGLPVNGTATGHYRVTGPLSALEESGRVISRVSYESPSMVEIERLSPDTIVLQGRYSEGSAGDILRMKKYSSALRIFELDDYVVSAPKKNSHTRNKPANTEQMLREGIAMCDRVVVTTQPLADALSSMHSDIRVVPNMLAPDPWATLTSRRGTSSKPRVGWGGGTSHTGDLEIIADVVRELANEVEWVFFGMCPDELRPYLHEFHPAISLQSYPFKLASLNLDLALAPLEFHIFNDCKSNLRLLEYGACGYPVICTDTEAYRGFLPCTKVLSNSTEEWLQAIRMHLADPAASYRMGDELRAAVHRDFMLRSDNLQHWLWGWLPD
ncbi:glycosyltransferase [Pseudomonas sp. B11]